MRRRWLYNNNSLYSVQTAVGSGGIYTTNDGWNTYKRVISSSYSDIYIFKGDNKIQTAVGSNLLITTDGWETYRNGFLPLSAFYGDVKICISPTDYNEQTLASTEALYITQDAWRSYHTLQINDIYWYGIAITSYGYSQIAIGGDSYGNNNIYRSYDGWNNYEIINNIRTENFIDISVWGGNSVGYEAAITDSNIYYTDSEWNDFIMVNGYGNKVDISYTNKDIQSVISNYGELFTTNNSWSSVNLTSLSFSNISSGISISSKNPLIQTAVGGNIYTTTDGWKTYKINNILTGIRSISIE